jgi:shikimate O-hydroxycinnamoyltransferase
VGDLLATPLGNVADMIKKGVAHVDDAYARSVIDYLEMEGPREVRMSETDLWVVSWLGMPMYDADFGWGLPRFVFPAEMFLSGMAFVTQRADRNDGISVLLALEPENLQRFEDVFCREY